MTQREFTDLRVKGRSLGRTSTAEKINSTTDASGHDTSAIENDGRVFNQSHKAVPTCLIHFALNVLGKSNLFPSTSKEWLLSLPCS